MIILRSADRLEFPFTILRIVGDDRGDFLGRSGGLFWRSLGVVTRAARRSSSHSGLGRAFSTLSFDQRGQTLGVFLHLRACTRQGGSIDAFKILRRRRRVHVGLGRHHLLRVAVAGLALIPPHVQAFPPWRSPVEVVLPFDHGRAAVFAGGAVAARDLVLVLVAPPLLVARSLVDRRLPTKQKLAEFFFEVQIA